MMRRGLRAAMEGGHKVRPFVVLITLLVAPAFAAPVAERVAAVALTVADMDRSLTFYRDVLTFEAESDVEVDGEAYEKLFGVFGVRLRQVTLRLGDERLRLVQFLAPEGRPIPVDSRSNDLWFQHVAIVVRDMDEAYARLRRHAVRHASTGPQRLPEWNPNAGGIRAFYFKDPDGHTLEVIWFPPGKGDPRWACPAERLFRGIDHTAIVVRETEASLGFWRDALGLSVAGGSENYGIEQERLNNVQGARLRITTLRAAQGPGVELLEYLAPRDGRPRPGDARANDVLYWQTELAVPSAASACRGRAVALPSPALGYRAGCVVPDPDGHGVALLEIEP